MYTGTISEKILSRAAGRRLRAGDLAICAPDLAMGTDGSVPMALDYLAQMQPVPAGPAQPQRLLFALDHYGSASGTQAQALQERVRQYARRHGVQLLEVGDGIGHQIVLESGAARPGLLLAGADSHAVSYGAVNAFATGIGSSDLAGIMLCGQLWLKVPQTLQVNLRGRLQPGASAKDVALFLAGTLGADGAAYRVLEFCGAGVAALDMDDRIVLANMSVEVGAKAGIFPFDEITERWLRDRPGSDCESVSPDANAAYCGRIEIDLDAIVPQLALPHRVDNVVDLAAAPVTRVDLVYLGTCTGGRLKDYREALDVLRQGGGIAPGVQVVVTPASAQVRAELESSGMLGEFAAMGALIQPPGCGSCCGTCGMVPADGANVVSTANRNFQGRMGNGKSAIFLASPRTCAAAAATGWIGDVAAAPRAELAP
jgi:3-isopropylmalate/(R)-2-methylmalate dehydratase large subunit